MSMSVVSDSVENEKDFAPPTKKSKVDKDDSVGEEHNTDPVASLSVRQIFDIWCNYVGGVKYKDKEEESDRFANFQKSLRLDLTEEDEPRNNFALLADHPEEEFMGYFKPYISKSFVAYMMQFEPDNTDDVLEWTKEELEGNCNYEMCPFVMKMNKGT